MGVYICVYMCAWVYLPIKHKWHRNTEEYSKRMGKCYFPLKPMNWPARGVCNRGKDKTSWVWGQPELYNETLVSKIVKNKTKTQHTICFYVPIPPTAKHPSPLSQSHPNCHSALGTTPRSQHLDALPNQSTPLSSWKLIPCSRKP